MEGGEVKRLSKEKLELQRTKEVLALSNNSLFGRGGAGGSGARAARLHEEQQSLQKERAQISQGMLDVLDDEKAKVSEKNAAMVGAMEKNQLHMVLERESYEELRKKEVTESEEYIAELEEKMMSWGHHWTSSVGLVSSTMSSTSCFARKGWCMHRHHSN
jgi:hypothetical protein